MREGCSRRSLAEQSLYEYSTWRIARLKSGSIVNVSWIFGLVGGPNRVAPLTAIRLSAYEGRIPNVNDFA